MSDQPLPCPLCHSPHTTLARNLKDIVEQAFCKACGCAAPIGVWSVRPTPGALELLSEFNDAAVLDMLMEGPRLQGFNQSALRRLWPKVRAAIAKTETTKPTKFDPSAAR